MKEFFENWWFFILMMFIASVLSFTHLYIWHRERWKAKWWEILIIAFSYTVAGVLCVRFWSFLEAGFDPEKADNMSLFGVVLALPLFFFIHALIKKIPIKVVFDAMTISVAETLFLARLNCIRSGCCGGIMTSAGWRVPTREIELCFYAIFLIFTFGWIIKGKSNGLAYPVFLVSYGLFRFTDEWFRTTEVLIFGVLHRGHIWGLASFAIGLSLIIGIIVYRKKKNVGQVIESKEG